MTKILITGGGGFIGSHLVEALSKKNEVTVAERKIENRIKNVKYVECDVTNPKEVEETVKGYDYVYHLAALLDESLPKKRLFDVNVGGTINVLEACKKHGLKRLIYLSTTGVMGETKEKANEKTRYNPKTNYEKSKALAEILVKEYYKRYKIPVIIIRSALVYGPNDYTLGILEKAKEVFPILGSGKNKTHFVYIENLISALVKAKTKGKDGEVYIVADEKPSTYEEFYRVIREELGIEKEPSHVPVWIGKIMAFFYNLFGKSSIVTSEHIDRLIRNRWYSIRKAKTDLGYKPRYDLESGMRKTIKYFKKEGLL